MSYARNLLSRGEEVVLESRQHWFAVIGQTWLWIFVAFPASGCSSSSPPEEPGRVAADRPGAHGRRRRCAAGRPGTHRLGDMVLAQPGVSRHHAPRDQGGGHLQQGDGRFQAREDQRREAQPELGGADLRLRHARHPDRRRGVGGGPIDDFPMLADPVDFKKAMLNQKEMLERPDLAPPATSASSPRRSFVAPTRCHLAPAATASPRCPVSTQSPPPSRTRRHQAPPRSTTSPPRSSASPACATRDSSRRKSTRPRSASCWSGCRCRRLGWAPCPTESTESSSSAGSMRPRRRSPPGSRAETLPQAQLAIVLGSGLGGVVDLLDRERRVQFPIGRSPRPGRSGCRPRRRAGRGQRRGNRGAGPLRSCPSVRGLFTAGGDHPAARLPAAGRAHGRPHQRGRRPEPGVRPRRGDADRGCDQSLR